MIHSGYCLYNLPYYQGIAKTIEKSSRLMKFVFDNANSSQWQ